MFEEIPYGARVAALVVLMATVATVERVRLGSRATRWREYTFVLVAGLATGLFGMANDLLTSSLSPGYFVIGKDLPAATLPGAAMLLGLKAGFSSGAIAAAICVWAATRRSASPPMPLRDLARMLWRPFLLAVALAAVFALVLSSADPLDLRGRIGPLLTENQADRFLRVWWIHLGLYLGLLLGLSWTLVSVWRRRSGPRV